VADFERQPTLRGARLELRPLRAEDFARLFLAASDPLIWEVHPSSDRWRPEVFKAFFEEAMLSGGAFAVVDLRDGRIAGTSRYYDVSDDSVAIGFTFLTREFWGGSYNRELKTLMLEHAFGFVDKVIFHVGEHNVRSRRAMEKIGGVLIGKREKLGPDGKPRTDVIFLIAKTRAGASR
jgi:RimJ/RimL family protein N-acetyltransferase